MYSQEGKLRDLHGGRKNKIEQLMRRVIKVELIEQFLEIFFCQTHAGGGKVTRQKQDMNYEGRGKKEGGRIFFAGFTIQLCPCCEGKEAKRPSAQRVKTGRGSW